MNAHRNQPITGDVLLFGRQTMSLTAPDVIARLRAFGIEPQITLDECEFDRETRVGGENQPQRAGQFLSDRSFMRLLGVDNACFLDHSDYEGADLLFDLNEPLPPELEGTFDFIIDGGTLDNVFNPTQAMMNIARMLRAGGRVLTYNMFSNHLAPYTMLPHQWYLDYFAINNFAFAQTYYSVHDPGGAVSVYQVNLRKRASTRDAISSYPVVDRVSGVGLASYAVKGEHSTWNRQPSQEIYRIEPEWRAMEPAFARFASYRMPHPIMKSDGTAPIELPGGDDFEYLDVEGHACTIDGYDRYYQKMVDNLLRTIIQMDARYPTAAWGILETEKAFFDLVANSAEARAIFAKDNVLLFDARMLNTQASIDGVTKRIYPAAAAMLVEMPIVVVSFEPNMETFWLRASRYFRHTNLVAGCKSFQTFDRAGPEAGGGPYRYFDAQVYLSPSLESGAYFGSPALHMESVRELLDKLPQLSRK